MTENWVDIPGYEGRFKVSDMGNVRALPRIVTCKDGRKMAIKGKPLMTPTANESGHLRVNLEGRLHYIHKLVMLAFIGPPPPKQEVRHGPTGPADNRLANLSYGTRSQNMYDKVAHGNHFQAAKTHCPRGHELKEPNNSKQRRAEGRRECLACNQARSYIRYRGLPESDMQTISDQHYKKIMEPAQ